MEVLLIILAIVIIPWLVVWVFKKIRAILKHIRYSKTLVSMESSIHSVPLQAIESELTRLNSVSVSLFGRLESQYKVRNEPEPKSLLHYISHDQAVQRAMRKKPLRSGQSRYYRRRWY